MDALEMDDVRRVYGEVRALDGISLSLARGTFTAVMGPSGSGKSTFLHCAAGLDAPTSGRVRLAGHDLATLSERDRTRLRRDRVGFVFQAFNLVGSLTAAQNVALPARLARRRVPAPEIAAALDAVGLADRSGHRPAQLSGGQQQRVAIARALVTRPEVLFADEPTGSLDSAASAGVLGLLRRMVSEGGGTVVTVTHDPAVAARADSVVVLRDGRVDGRLAVRPGDPRAAADIASHLAGRAAA